MKIINPLRRAEIVSIALHKGVGDTEDIDRFLKAWLWHRPLSAWLDDPVDTLIAVAASMGRPDLSEADAREIIKASERGRPLRKADDLGQYLRLLDSERTEWGIRTIGGHDVPKRQRTLRRKRRDRERHAERRRQNGAKPHSESFSRLQPWKTEGVSRKTWERRRLTQIRPQSLTQIRRNTCRKFVRNTLSTVSRADLRQLERKQDGNSRMSSNKERDGQEMEMCVERGTPMMGTNECKCELCGDGGANVAYFRTGMTEVVYRHHECDRHGELSPSEERQEWGINKWLTSDPPTWSFRE